jgi:UDP-N-acetylmuramoyl-tripeptide--D-alanyl-D-alanine ligase
MFRTVEIIRATGGSLLKGKPSGGVSAVSTDSRTITAGALFIPLRGKNFDGHNFIAQAAKRGACAFLIEKDFYKRNSIACQSLPKSASCIVVRDTLKALGDLACFRRKKFNLPLIAVTGSSGKTTTKDMIAALLAARFRILKNEGTQNNLVGVPLNILKLDSGHRLACLELGTSSFGEIARLTEIVRPTVGIITNIGQAHLEQLHSKEGVLKEKSQLLKGLQHPKVSLINYDDPYLRKLKNRHKLIFGFGIKKECDFFAQRVRIERDKVCFSLHNSKQRFALNSLGVHNIYNALAGIAIARIFGLDQKTIAKGLARFIFPVGRFTIVKKGTLTIIDDTYNANPLSLGSALESTALIAAKGRKILVIADMLELGSQTQELHRKMGREIAKKDFDFLLTFGPLAEHIGQAARESSFHRKNIFSTCNIDELNARLSRLVKAADTVLVKGSHAMRMERVVSFLRAKKTSYKNHL